MNIIKHLWLPREGWEKSTNISRISWNGYVLFSDSSFKFKTWQEFKTCLKVSMNSIIVLTLDKSFKLMLDDYKQIFNILLFRNSTKHNRINRRLNNENIHLNALKPFVNRYLSCWLLSISSRWVNNRLVFSYHKIIIKITQCYLDFYISWWIIWVCQGLYSSQVLMDYGGIHNCSGNKF